MNQIEEITFRYLSSCLGDLSEATEDAVIDAIARINLINKALQEQVSSASPNKEDKPVSLKDAIMKQLYRVVQGEITPEEFEETGPMQFHLKMQRTSPEFRAKRTEDIRSKITPESLADTKKEVEKTQREHGNLGDDFLSRHEKFLQDLDPSEREEIMKTPEFKQAIEDGEIRSRNIPQTKPIKDEPYIGSDLFNRLKSFREQYDPFETTTGNIRYDTPEMKQAREQGKRINKMTGQVGPGMYAVPGSQRGSSNIDRTSNTGQGVDIPWNQDVMDQIVQERPSSPEAREAARRHQEETRPERAADKLDRDMHSDRVRLALTNRRRAARKMSPLTMDQLVNTKAPKTMRKYGDLINQYYGRGQEPEVTPQSEEDYMASQFPGGVAPAGARTITRPDGTSYSTLGSQSVNPFSTQGIIDALRKRAGFASPGSPRGGSPVI